MDGIGFNNCVQGNHSGWYNLYLACRVPLVATHLPPLSRGIHVVKNQQGTAFESWSHHLNHKFHNLNRDHVTVGALSGITRVWLNESGKRCSNDISHKVIATLIK